MVDAPGYGYARIGKGNKKKFGLMMEDYLTNRPNLKQVFMLVDFRHKPSKDDILMLNFLKHYDIPVTIVATKADKISVSTQQKQRAIILKELELSTEHEFIVFSNITKVGRNEVLEKIERII